ncbi:26576_t:CDS:2 [Racocetra persica]|uniref:26576_t:CDS:1 n=1 Tax=Racocetra persica TaxID=160502 RepID=A0ACA9Q793_9GLOM|nr:26576_t:CDS:2 [Racocetra persica]
MGESNSNYISYATSNKCPDDCGRCNICIANNIWVCAKEHRGKLSTSLSNLVKEKEIEEIEKLHNICGNKEIAEFLYKCKCVDNSVTRWIPFDEFEDIEYLGKGGFGIVHKATWSKAMCLFGKYVRTRVVLKSLDCDVSAILKELKPYYEVKDTYDTYDYFMIKCYGITQKPNTKEYLMINATSFQ